MNRLQSHRAVRMALQHKLGPEDKALFLEVVARFCSSAEYPKPDRFLEELQEKPLLKGIFAKYAAPGDD